MMDGDGSHLLQLAAWTAACLSWYHGMDMVTWLGRPGWAPGYHGFAYESLVMLPFHASGMYIYAG